MHYHTFQATNKPVQIQHMTKQTTFALLALCLVSSIAASPPTFLRGRSLYDGCVGPNEPGCVEQKYCSICATCMCQDGADARKAGKNNDRWCNTEVAFDHTGGSNGCILKKQSGETCGQHWECMSGECQDIPFGGQGTCYGKRENKQNYETCEGNWECISGKCEESDARYSTDHSKMCVP